MSLQSEAKKLRNKGFTYPEIGKLLGISKSNARYLADDDYRERSRKASREAKARRAGRCHGCGRRTGYNGQNGVGTSKFCHPCRARQRATWTPEAILNAIQSWATEHEGNPPDAMAWNPSLARLRGHELLARAFDNDDRWPNAVTVAYYFGSWNNAIRQAGFTPRKVGGRGPMRIGRSW